mmetsp:Transcript_16982/g.23751  ORF Transcript_16982/g.23751 Transcript_16982/m.23751 type:complete len:359 (+) Transcript_16982:120-1196(+)
MRTYFIPLTTLLFGFLVLQSSHIPGILKDIKCNETETAILTTTVISKDFLDTNVALEDSDYDPNASQSALVRSGSEMERRNSKRKYALVLFGGVSRLYHSMHARDIYDTTEPIQYTPLNVTGTSLMQHIVDINGGGKNFDLFIHSWNEDLEDKYMEIFDRNDVNHAWSLFEDNSLFETVYKPLLSNAEYKDNWRMMSLSASLSRGAMAVMQHIAQKRNGTQYERVVFIRPDIIMTADMNLSSPVYAPKPNIVHVDRHPRGDGDFYFLLSSREALEEMARLVLDVAQLPKSKIQIHGFIQRAFRKHNFTFLIDRIKPGINVEVWRKLCKSGVMIDRGKEFYRRYGVSNADWNDMLSLCK